MSDAGRAAHTPAVALLPGPSSAEAGLVLQ